MHKGHAVIARTAAAARLCGISRFTLWRWTLDDVRVRACLFKRGWYKVESLAALGLCTVPTPAAMPVKRRVAS